MSLYIVCIPLKLISVDPIPSLLLPLTYHNMCYMSNVSNILFVRGMLLTLCVNLNPPLIFCFSL